MSDNGDPVVYGVLHSQGKNYVIKCYSWLAFMLRINEIMREFKVEFPVGEDGDLRMVKTKVKNTERFKA